MTGPCFSSDHFNVSVRLHNTPAESYVESYKTARKLPSDINYYWPLMESKITMYRDQWSWKCCAEWMWT